jgi:hypothetical protein
MYLFRKISNLFVHLRTLSYVTCKLSRNEDNQRILSNDILFLSVEFLVEERTEDMNLVEEFWIGNF